MHPMYDYETLRLGRAELLRRAERERLARQVVCRQFSLEHVVPTFAAWLGTRLMRLGVRLVRLSHAQGM